MGRVNEHDVTPIIAHVREFVPRGYDKDLFEDMVALLRKHGYRVEHSNRVMSLCVRIAAGELTEVETKYMHKTVADSGAEEGDT